MNCLALHDSALKNFRDPEYKMQQHLQEKRDLHDGDVILVDVGRKSPSPPDIFILHDGMGLVTKRLENIPNNDPPMVRVISDNNFYSPYERTLDEVNIIGKVRWYAREI